MIRFFEVLIVATLLGCSVGAAKAAWYAPGDRVQNIPKQVRSSHSSYRKHYRSTYVYVGGK